MAPVTIPLSPHRAYSTWQGATIGPVVVSGSVPSSPMTRVRMYFRDSSDAFGYGFDSDVVDGMGLITILNAATWHAQIYPQFLPLSVGSWEWDIQITSADEQIIYPYEGDLKVTRSITHD